MLVVKIVAGTTTLSQILAVFDFQFVSFSFSAPDCQLENKTVKVNVEESSLTSSCRVKTLLHSPSQDPGPVFQTVTLPFGAPGSVCPENVQKMSGYV